MLPRDFPASQKGEGSDSGSASWSSVGGAQAGPSLPESSQAEQVRQAPAAVSQASQRGSQLETSVSSSRIDSQGSHIGSYAGVPPPRGGSGLIGRIPIAPGGGGVGWSSHALYAPGMPPSQPGTGAPPWRPAIGHVPTHPAAGQSLSSLYGQARSGMAGAVGQYPVPGSRAIGDAAMLQSGVSRQRAASECAEAGGPPEGQPLGPGRMAASAVELQQARESQGLAGRMPSAPAAVGTSPYHAWVAGQAASQPAALWSQAAPYVGHPLSRAQAALAFAPRPHETAPLQGMAPEVGRVSHPIGAAVQPMPAAGTSLSEATRAHRIGRTSSDFTRGPGYMGSRGMAHAGPSLSAGPIFTDMSASTSGSSGGAASAPGERLHHSQSFPIGDFTQQGHGPGGEPPGFMGVLHPFSVQRDTGGGAALSSGGPGGALGHPLGTLGALGALTEDLSVPNNAGGACLLGGRSRQGSGEHALSGSLAFEHESPQARAASPPSSILSGDFSARLDQLGADAGPSVPAPTAARTNKVRLVCSSGGRFVRSSTGSVQDYEGGDTRLVNVSSVATLSELQEAVERVSTSPSTDAQLVPHLKYQLPSQLNIYLDLVEDEDVALMFEEWAEFVASNRAAIGQKLHVFVEWLPQRASAEAARGGTGISSAGAAAPGPKPGSEPDAGEKSSGQSQLHLSGRSSEEAHSGGSGETMERRSGHPPAQLGDNGQGRGRNRGLPFNVHEIAERMEIIEPSDITLVKFLGAGGYGEVYLGKWHNSEAAIKCLNPSLFCPAGAGDAVSAAAIKDLLYEADLLGSLRHPNVVWVYGIVLPRMEEEDLAGGTGDAADAVEIAAAVAMPMQQGGGVLRAPAIVTEFMSGGSLRQALARRSDAIAGGLARTMIAMDAAKGMEYLHGKRIVHFDLKSANLLLGHRDRRVVCKVADFGLSKQRRANTTYVSNVTAQRGTLPWIAPEIIRTPNTVTDKADVYSFGVVLWELWTGREPYEGLNYHALLHQITTSNGQLRPPLPGAPDWEFEPLPEPAPGWRSVIERCWQAEPHCRPSFAKLVQELKEMATALRPPRPQRSQRPQGGGQPASQGARLASTPEEGASDEGGAKRGAAPEPQP